MRRVSPYFFFVTDDVGLETDIALCVSSDCKRDGTRQDGVAPRALLKAHFAAEGFPDGTKTGKNLVRGQRSTRCVQVITCRI